MLTWLAKLILFYTAYTPLFLILIVKNFRYEIIPFWSLSPNHNLIWSIVILCVIVLLSAVILMCLLLWRISKVTGNINEIEVLANLNNENLTFLLTYGIPVIMEIKGARDFISLAILLIVILLVYMKSDLLMYNIFFNIFGYNIYKVMFNGEEFFLINKGNLAKGKYTLSINILHGNILV